MQPKHNWKFNIRSRPANEAILTINASLFQIVRGGHFLMRAKHIIGDFDVVFRVGQDFFDPKIVLSAVEREEHNFNILYIFDHRL